MHRSVKSWEKEYPAECEVPYDTMQELMAMQENGPRNLGFFGTRNMGFMHQNLIEVLSYAMVLTVSHPCHFAALMMLSRTSF